MIHLSGLIDHVIFEKGRYKILKIKIIDHENKSKIGNVITCLGNIEFNVSVGDELDLEGEAKFNEDYNCYQFSIEKASKRKVSFTMFSRIVSRVKGIGPSKSKELFDLIKSEDKFQCIIKHPQTLAGILNEEQIINLRETCSLFVEKREFLDELYSIENLTDYQIGKIKKFFSELKSIKQLKENIYDLVGEFGFGFKRTDQIALKIGISKDDESRIRAGIIYSFELSQSNGDVYIEGDDLARKSIELLNINFEKIVPIFKKLVDDCNIVKIECDKKEYKLKVKSIFNENQNIKNIKSRFKIENIREIKRNKLKSISE